MSEDLILQQINRIIKDLDEMKCDIKEMRKDIKKDYTITIQNETKLGYINKQLVGIWGIISALTIFAFKFFVGKLF